ncbi:MAG: hypothetical protein KDD83_08430 [Caldilineaceae bacterium]|nr:hypothetical protein [Caldilineaceae bacterium]
MNAADARALARQWVDANAASIPGLRGAFLHGSINALADAVELSPTSDVDLMLVLDGTVPPLKLGKFLYAGVLLEVSYLPSSAVATTEAVLHTYAIAESLRYPGVIYDPSGQLTAVQRAVARAFPQRTWVRVRCEEARQKVLRAAQAVPAAGPYHDRVSAWLFAAGLTTHILLLAGLRNPTVRKRYLAVRTLLDDYGHGAFYATLLGLMGAADLQREQVEAHLLALSAAFDAAGAVLTTPYQFAADMRPDARAVAIDGSRELVRQGNHREALFWMTAVYSRCMHVLTVDGTPGLPAEHAAGYQRLLADLGIHGAGDLERGAVRIEATLPAVWAVAETIMAANSDIVD